MIIAATCTTDTIILSWFWFQNSLYSHSHSAAIVFVILLKDETSPKCLVRDLGFVLVYSFLSENEVANTTVGKTIADSRNEQLEIFGGVLFSRLMYRRT